MEIKIIGDQAIFLKGKKESILINPEESDLSNSKLQSRIVVYMSEDKGNIGIEADKVSINGPGEYEIGGVEILGINAGNGDSVYTINIDGVNVGVLGCLHEPLSDKKIEKVNAVDVLLAAVDHNDKIDNKMILDWAKKWGANYLIPFGYLDESEDYKKFLDLTDQEGIEPVDSLKIDKDNLPEGLEVVVLEK